jgi:hypothetical protein
MKTLSLFLLVASLILACTSGAEQDEPVRENAQTENTDDQDNTANDQATELNIEALVAEINAYRASVENKKAELNLKELPTSELREQIRQKWQSIHFYFDSEALVRVKTYPHDGISSRTEEFYFQNGNLVSAHILDEGTVEGADPYASAKSYYFYMDNLIHEENNSGEAEFSIRESDGERLLQEAMEYLEISEGV